MILAAGKGERMRPLTLEKPKPLLEVAGKPLIAYHLEKLATLGIERLVINVSWLGSQIVDYCGDGSRWNLAIEYSREPEPLDTAGGIVQALPRLGDEPFLVISADIFTDYDFSRLVAAVSQVGPAMARFVLVDNPAHHQRGDFSLSGERIVPRAERSLTFAGIGLYDPRFFAGCEPGKRPLLPLLNRAIEERRLYGEHYAGVWTDVGTPERLDALNAAASARTPIED